jgi:hypothetical protein
MISNASWRTATSFSRVIGEGGLVVSFRNELLTGDPDPAAADRNDEILFRLTVLGWLFLSLSLEEGVSPFGVCFMVFLQVSWKKESKSDLLACRLRKRNCVVRGVLTHTLKYLFLVVLDGIDAPTS